MANMMSSPPAGSWDNHVMDPSRHQVTILCMQNGHHQRKRWHLPDDIAKEVGGTRPTLLKTICGLQQDIDEFTGPVTMYSDVNTPKQQRGIKKNALQW